jgi:hypothetical protein
MNESLKKENYPKFISYNINIYVLKNIQGLLVNAKDTMWCSNMVVSRK